MRTAGRLGVVFALVCLPLFAWTSSAVDGRDRLAVFARLATLDAHVARSDPALLDDVAWLEDEWRVRSDPATPPDPSGTRLDLRDADVADAAHALLVLSEWYALAERDLERLGTLTRALAARLVERRPARDGGAAAWAVYALANARRLGLDVGVDGVRAGLDAIADDAPSKHALAAIVESLWDVDLAPLAPLEAPLDRVDDEDFFWLGVHAARRRHDDGPTRREWSAWRRAERRRERPSDSGRPDGRDGVFRDLADALSKGRRVGAVVATWIPPDDGWGRA